ncbi:MAG: hypothetical protein HeimC2_26360 [Candidatus Heimdallarchaeota archaeon LC_2]|nr:MAG: hypothetical protein HeimC2_26360 [Candidatus Heimdallarchaeota archaeon LC_2]
MSSKLIRIIFTFVLLSILITSASGQDNYYEDPIYGFSERLKEGVEITWIIPQYSILMPEFNESEQTTIYTGYDEYTSTNENGDEVVETITYEYTEENYYYEYPDIPVNTLLEVIILKDLAKKTNSYYYSDFYDDSHEYFDMSVSKGNESEIIEFLSPDLLFRPSVLEFENGTVLNAIEYEYEQQQKYIEDETFDGPNPEEFYLDFSIKDGVYIEKTNFSFENETNKLEMRVDVETGVLLYVYALSEGLDFRFEIEMKLHESAGINLNNAGPNEELSLPLSPFFVYALLIVPIIVSKFRRN